ncbi:MAG: 16S rRNA (adenine(1518)-N(6)/adenine(1519)-N(6))-dimethyltransferase RsmA [Candidatus Berkelbacteria bacterium]|nr:16S rRNA (adenine(1518)-N(6)/adenine(1519)-N(6))-dimethyltransferase RsmA [Candidatus Berkelbacteria bacterium]
MKEKVFAKKSLGQHFLKSERVLDGIVKAAEIKKEDTVFEIGPGTGNLTQKLLASPAKMIIACEKDDELYRSLLEKFKSKRLKLIHQDALLLIPGLQAESPLKVVANLPYNIASPAIISLLSVCPTLPERLVVMVQKEVAERLTAKPDDSNRGLLTVFLELFGTVKIIEKVSRSQFYPPPQVESAVILIGGIKRPEFKPKDTLKILKLAFAGKRKKIKNSLFSSLQISSSKSEVIATECGISLDQRPEELDRNQWAKLINSLVNSLE